MTSAHSVFSLICLLNIAQQNLLSSSSVHQERRFISLDVGGTVTLECLDQDNKVSILFWYKQVPGQEPQVICSHNTNKFHGTFRDDFKDKHRFTSYFRDKTLHLRINPVRASDSAVYYCVKPKPFSYSEFSEGTTVFVNQTGLSSETLVLQSDSETIHSGDSVSLTCTAYTESCEGEPSVYWFKNSEDHQPSLIYTQRDNNHQCERRNHTQTHTCVSNLSLTNLDQSKAGTYYCAVTVCGRVVFGNGTRLDFNPEKLTTEKLTIAVYVLTVAVLVTTIMVIVLMLVTYKTYRKVCCGSTASSASVKEDISQCTEDLNYAAVSFNLHNRSPDRDRMSVCTQVLTQTHTEML